MVVARRLKQFEVSVPCIVMLQSKNYFSLVLFLGVNKNLQKIAHWCLEKGERSLQEGLLKGMAYELGERNGLLSSNYYVPGVAQVQFWLLTILL